MGVHHLRVVKSHVKGPFDKFQTCDVACPISCANIVENWRLVAAMVVGFGKCVGLHVGLFASQGGHLNCPPLTCGWTYTISLTNTSP